MSQTSEPNAGDREDPENRADPAKVVAALQAEIDLLRADVSRWRAIAVDNWSAATGELTKVEIDSKSMHRRLSELQHQHHVLSGQHHELSGTHHELTVAHHELNVAYVEALRNSSGGAVLPVPERLVRPLRWLRDRRLGSAR